MALLPDQRARLVKLAGLLASTHSGERAAAALKCTEFLAGLGTTWAEALEPTASGPAVTIVRPAEPRTWRVVCDELVVFHFAALFDREVEFVTGMLSRGFAPSPRQAAWLMKICRRCGVSVWDDAAIPTSGPVWGTTP